MLCNIKIYVIYEVIEHVMETLMKHQKKAFVAANVCLYQSSAKSNLQDNVVWLDMITLK